MSKGLSGELYCMWIGFVTVHAVLHPKDADRTANSVDPDQGLPTTPPTPPPQTPRVGAV